MSIKKLFSFPKAESSLNVPDCRGRSKPNFAELCQLGNKAAAMQMIRSRRGIKHK